MIKGPQLLSSSLRGRSHGHTMDDGRERSSQWCTVVYRDNYTHELHAHLSIYQ